MPKGSNLKGKPKIGGRTKGTPNRRTTEAVERARIDVENAKASGKRAIEGIKKKLAKDVLEEFMMLFAGMAAAYQPLPAGVSPPPGRTPDEGKFQTYAKLAVDTARALADFQSPKFRAIAVVAAPTEQDRPGDGAKLLNPDNVVQLKDATAIARVYQRMVKRVG